MMESVLEDACQTITYKRRNQKIKRVNLLSAFPAEEVHHELKDKTCPDCHHDAHRSGLVALAFPDNYSRFLHCDMWQAYTQLLATTLVNCWAHVRRKFKDNEANEKSIVKQRLNLYNKMFYLEKAGELHLI